MLGPVTIGLILSGLAAAGKATSAAIGAAKEKKLAKKRTEEMKQQTMSDFLQSLQDRQMEQSGANLQASRQLGAGRTRRAQDLAANVRGALRI